MPLPEPGNKETEQQFLSRCMEVLASEYPDTAQRYAVCLRQLDARMTREVSERHFKPLKQAKGT